MHNLIVGLAARFAETGIYKSVHTNRKVSGIHHNKHNEEKDRLNTHEKVHIDYVKCVRMGLWCGATMSLF